MTNKQPQRQNGLVGKWFYNIDDDAMQIQDYGRVLAQVNQDVFLVQLLTLDNELKDQRLILVSDMMAFDFADSPLETENGAKGVA